MFPQSSAPDLVPGRERRSVSSNGVRTLTGGRTAEPALSDVAVDASRVTGVAQIRQPERRERTHVHGHVIP